MQPWSVTDDDYFCEISIRACVGAPALAVGGHAWLAACVELQPPTSAALHTTCAGHQPLALSSASRNEAQWINSSLHCHIMQQAEEACNW